MDHKCIFTRLSSVFVMSGETMVNLPQDGTATLLIQLFKPTGSGAPPTVTKKLLHTSSIFFHEDSSLRVIFCESKQKQNCFIINYYCYYYGEKLQLQIKVQLRKVITSASKNCVIDTDQALIFSDFLTEHVKSIETIKSQWDTAERGNICCLYTFTIPKHNQFIDSSILVN